MKNFLNLTSENLHPNQSAITANILIKGIYLGFSLNLHSEVLEPRQNIYDLDACITGLDAILGKMKTHKMAISKLRHYKAGYLATIFLPRLYIHLHTTSLRNHS